MDNARVNQLVQEFQKKWKRKSFLAGRGIVSLADQIDAFTGEHGADYGCVEEIRKDFEKEEKALPGAFMRKRYRRLVEMFVPGAYVEDYYRIIDRMNLFPYARGIDRRTVRSRRYGPWFTVMFELLNSYKMLQFYGCTLEDYLCGRLSEPMAKVRNQYQYRFRITHLDLMVAARIDSGDKAFIGLVTEMLLGDNNTAVVSSDVIRGIVRSDNERLYQLLADFLLAARLQEGVRQAVCESADCDVIPAFKVILQTIRDNDLMRFAAVKRAVATWTGLCDLEHVDRITDKVLESVCAALWDYPAKAHEFVGTNDSILIMCGLWSLGFHDVEDAIGVMEGYLDHGTRNQLLTMGYYNTMLQYQDYAYRTAARAIRLYPDDYELVAVFMPSFLKNADNYAFQAVDRRYGSNRGKRPDYKRIPVEFLYPSREEAYDFYDIMREIYSHIPKKRLEFFPVVFPWYGAYLSKTQLVIRMCVTAYALCDDELKDDACGRLSSIDVSENYANRSVYLELVAHDPRTPIQRRALLEGMADKESYTRQTAFRLVSDMELEEDEYLLLESFLKYKTAEIRKHLLELLNSQPPEKRLESAGRLLKGNKTELRMGGLSMLQELKRDEKAMADAAVCAAFDDTVARLDRLESLTDGEQVLVKELQGEGKAAKVLEEEGYGLYDPGRVIEMPRRQERPELVRNYLPSGIAKLERAFAALEEFYLANGNREYRTAYGSEALLINGLSPVTYDTSLPIWERYPFRELWEEFYETYIGSPKLLMQMQLALGRLEETPLQNRKAYERHIREVLGPVLGSYSPRLDMAPQNRYYRNALCTVVAILVALHPDEAWPGVAGEILNHIVYHIPEEGLWYDTVREEGRGSMYYAYRRKAVSLLNSERMNRVRGGIFWSSNEEFREWFSIFHDIDRRFCFNAHREEDGRYYSNQMRSDNCLGILDYVKAYSLGILPENEVFKAAFEYYPLEYTLDTLSLLLLDKWKPYQQKSMERYLKDGEMDRESDFYKKAVDIYRRMIDKVLDVELSRGDLATVFSKGVSKIQRFYGMERMVQILVALGRETLDRQTYYYGSDGETKKVVLSHLLNVCYPAPGDDAAGLARLLRTTRISEKRLYETMMYAPQWIDIIQEYLGLELKSGCYYFMAHMNETFDDRKMAVIAKYTPLSRDELNQGAFDLKWFKSAYETLGEEVFGRLYDAAKYISDGSKHSRARKYADAALGRVSVEELEEEICAKRNKDLLMSYGILPIAGETDVLHRYEFIANFRKASRQFGAQRRASEGVACDMALKNLATNAGYQDVTRLTLAMEARMAEQDSGLFRECELEGVTVKLAVDGYGKVEISCVRDGRTLKSVPAALKKHAYILRLKEAQKKLREQYRRTVAMMEQAMEEREGYRLQELCDLLRNPVTEPIVRSLVYITCDEESPVMGMLGDGGLSDENGTLTPFSMATQVRVAHPFDLYRAGRWHAYQKYLFQEISGERMPRQPFKQVFRELYVKLEEERDAYASRMFAGNQIQPQKTAGCLKGRRWIADYEEGLQKVYYRDNVIARIYALADWFSPSDIEAPTLEWVEFLDRGTFEPIKVSEVPDIIYSEVMRDVDLAVSVAHVGGVDPETSHSTMDMRRVIIGHNLPLFGLSNVSLEGHHAIVTGKLATYTIHLGSGVIHMAGGPQIAVLPVHSQSRGKLFLPFVDEDPKTAEIMSKIVLFARDDKIKDPFILQQIRQ